ncbi:isopenicillin-N N-acyltransferase like protein [Polaromonas sp. OV174]|uniref:C45 family autoproteolytic acyltransferase/hydolase n=1 Tax=Polaromonas sp. OV174 TaxID=1855300 RepID=UPI0008ED6304|nr:C45 family peptidase [Polaromonas sp. OV174]SFB72108.1 isopenicillin-N N-acyltransferase like protein [Polaromonas sp. OV174]
MNPVELFPLIELSGDARERGRQYGQKAAVRIRRSVDLYASQLGAMSLTSDAIRQLVNTFLPSIDEFDPLYVEEMRGIAEGANLDLADIVLINARTEILRLGKLQADAQRADREPDGCTGAVLLPEVTASGRLLHGQNWDWKAECATTGVVLKIRREDGPDILTFTEAGGLARCGLNSAGIAVTANYLSSDRDYSQVGVPLALLRRKILETEHVAQALKTVYCTPKSGSNNLMISHADGFALDIECAPDESFLIYPERDIVVHSNHWQSQVALGKLRDLGIASSPDSLYRDFRVRQILERARGQLTLDHLREAFFDDFATPWSVCRPPRDTEESNLSATVAMILMDPALGHLEVAPLPALNRKFATYSLKMDRSFSAAAAPVLA